MELTGIGPIEKLCAEEESRYSALQHVYFNAERGQLVACNGNAIIVLACAPDPGDTTGLITAEAMETYRQYERRNRVPHMVKLHAYPETLVVEDIADGRSLTLRRPKGEYPKYDMLLPKVSGPPSVSLDPSLLEQIVSAFPGPELGKELKSISLWLLPDHGTGVDPKKSKTPVPAIVVKAHPEGATAMLMPIAGLDESEWHTTLPQAVKPPIISEPSSTTTQEPPTPPTADKPSKRKAPRGTLKAPKPSQEQEVAS